MNFLTPRLHFLCLTAALVCLTASLSAFDRSKGWYGNIAERQGDERFMRIYFEDGTLYHDDGSEVALWGVNFQSAMVWEWRHSHAQLKWNRQWDSSYYEAWKAVVVRGFEELEIMGCDVIRIHLCPGDIADGDGNLIENDWLDMLDYTMAECYRRGIYVNLSLINHLGDGGTDAILSLQLKLHRWEAIVVPQKIEASENYIRQLVNRPNPHDGDRPYRENPAWIIAEIMNEPMWVPPIPSEEQFPLGIPVFDAWVEDNDMKRNHEAWRIFKTEKISEYIDRMDALLYELRLPAVPCWNLMWSKAPLQQGIESYEAAADTDIPVVSFSMYPGQDLLPYGTKRVFANVSEENFLPYLKESYENPDWQGWLQDRHFKNKKAIIVYEFEQQFNQSTYLYPAMAKYFRAQGAQIATMWTYYLNEDGYYLPEDYRHNLNLVSTPRKMASFLVAEEVFKSTPRYVRYRTTEEDADRFGNAALSLPKDLSAYADENIMIHSGDVDNDFLDIPRITRRIIGYGSSPFVSYEGRGLYFLEAGFESGKYQQRWDLSVMPDAYFDEEGQVVLDKNSTNAMTLMIPGMDHINWKVYRFDGDQRLEVISRAPAITFNAEPGDYEIVRNR